MVKYYLFFPLCENLRLSAFHQRSKKLCVFRGENVNALPPSSQRLPSMQPTPSLHAANALPIFYKFRSSPPNISPAKPPELLGFLLPLTRFYNVNIPHGKEKEKNPHQPPGHPPYRLRNSCRNRLLLPSVSTVSSGPHRLRIHRPRRHSRLHI